MEAYKRVDEYRDIILGTCVKVSYVQDLTTYIWRAFFFTELAYWVCRYTFVIQQNWNMIVCLTLLIHYKTWLRGCNWFYFDSVANILVGVVPSSSGGSKKLCFIFVWNVSQLCCFVYKMFQARYFVHQLPTEVASGFGIFKQNRDNPDEIGMVGHSWLW